MFRQFGPFELIIILVIVLLLFGATRLPQIGSALGASMRMFKRGITGEEELEGLEDQQVQEDKAGTKKSKT